MRPFRAVASILSMALVVVSMGSCADRPSPVEPTTTSEGLVSDLLGPPLSPMTVLTRTVPLSRDITASAVIGRSGGVIEIPEAGLRFEVPRRALRRDTEIRITAPAGNLVGYHFEPHGLEFARSARVTQSLRGTAAENAPELLSSMQAAYFQGELLPVIDPLEVLSLEFILRGRRADAVFGIDHFSGYVIALN